MRIEPRDPIAAIVTPMGEGGVALIRISGSGMVDIGRDIFRDRNGEAVDYFLPWRTRYGFIVGSSGERIDEVLITFMASPRSYTCEDQFEIGCHGGDYLAHQVLSRIQQLGVRLAGPGEFTKRAFLNGRIDLLQAEGVIDLVAADSERSKKLASDQLDGLLSERLRAIEGAIIDSVTALEGAIDFPDEELEIISSAQVAKKLSAVNAEIKEMIDSYDAGRIYRTGVSVAIIGRPNVGKSSLMNRLLERDRVIVTPFAGSTRDTVEELVSVAGIAIRLIDTAGIRESNDLAEVFGVKRSLAVAAEADITLLLLDGSMPLTADDTELLERIGVDEKKMIICLTKCDLPANPATEVAPMRPDLKISSTTGAGIDRLKEVIAERIRRRTEPFGERPVLSRQRHLEAMRLVAQSVTSAISALADGAEFAVAELQGAREGLNQLTGVDVTEEVISKIFDEFCIGK